VGATADAGTSNAYVAPQSFQPEVRLNGETGERELTIMRWGLVPFWSKDGKASFSTINAKSETIATSPAFREAWKTRRCLVPADWFYEWQKLDEKAKQPYAIAMKGDGMFSFAGLWEKWKDKTTRQALRTYTILATDPNELMKPIHNRMPVIIPPRDYGRWMAPTDPAHLPVDLLRPYPAAEMKAWKVAKAVGNTRNNDASFCECILCSAASGFLNASCIFAWTTQSHLLVYTRHNPSQLDRFGGAALTLFRSEKRSSAIGRNRA
jgi:putative SOS response-associated peptidase YedK